MLRELDWIADRGFIGTSVPGFTTYPNQPPLFEKYWDPFWARCEERGLALWLHAGYGERQGELGREVARTHRQIKSMGGSIEDMVKKLTSEVFNGELFSSAKPRRAMWQLMMSGVFDRFPRLKLVMNEVYADWMPATLRYLDAEFATNRAGLAAKRKPSHYWRSNGLTCLSFVHKAEVEMRHDIGLETITFGRDYPHTEGTWPNTKEWLRDAFAGVPLDELRVMLSENAIRYFNLDRAKLTAHAERIGATLEEIAGPGLPVDPALLAHFDARGQYLQPAEGGKRLPEIEAMFREDLWRTGVGA
jgi:predicted TIM-barrel fold metal-dependent hydrolase